FIRPGLPPPEGLEKATRSMNYKLTMWNRSFNRIGRAKFRRGGGAGGGRRWRRSGWEGTAGAAGARALAADVCGDRGECGGDDGCVDSGAAHALSSASHPRIFP